MQISFADCLLDTERRELRRSNQLVAVEPQVFDVLIYLVENRDRVVSKDDLISSVWNGRIVSESTLTSRINAARKAIGDTGEKQSLIRTVARKGVRFVAPIDAARDQQTPALAAPQRPSIAVLPFTNMSGDPEQDFFVDGVTEEIITALSRVRWFFVIARGSAFAYKGKEVTPAEIARELGVRYILTGSIRRSGDQIRVSAQLVDGNSCSNVWARSYDRALSDIFAVQDEITQTIVGGIEPELSRAERERARIKHRESVDAWSIYQRGMFHLYRYTREDLGRRKSFSKARLLSTLSWDLRIRPSPRPIITKWCMASSCQTMLVANARSMPQKGPSRSIGTMRVHIVPWDEFATSVGNTLPPFPNWKSR